MRSTRAVSQPDSTPLNEELSKSFDMPVTRAVSQPEMSSLKPVSVKRQQMSRMRETSQPEMCPKSASAPVASINHFSTAVCSAAFDWKRPPIGGGDGDGDGGGEDGDGGGHGEADGGGDGEAGENDGGGETAAPTAAARTATAAATADGGGDGEAGVNDGGGDGEGEDAPVRPAATAAAEGGVGAEVVWLLRQPPVVDDPLAARVVFERRPREEAREVAHVHLARRPIGRGPAG